MNQKKFKSIVIAGLFLLLSTSSHAFVRGGTGSHGGDAYVCQDPLWSRAISALFLTFDTETVFLADTFETLTDLSPDTVRFLKQVNQLDETIILAASIQVIETQDSQLADRLKAHLKSFKWTMVSKLEELDDDDIQGLPRGCKKRQLAIQNLESGKIRVQQTLFNHLSRFERAMLQLHEAYIKDGTRAEDRLKNTILIREKVLDIAQQDLLRDSLKMASWCPKNLAHVYTFQFVKNIYLKNKKLKFADAADTDLNYYLPNSSFNEFTSTRALEFAVNLLSYATAGGGQLTQSKPMTYGLARGTLEAAFYRSQLSFRDLGNILDRLMDFSQEDLAGKAVECGVIQ